MKNSCWLTLQQVWNFFCQLFWVRKGLVISSSIPAMVVRRGEPDSREWETWSAVAVEATYQPEPWRGIVQAAFLIRQVIKTSAMVRGEIAITRCIFLITLPSCCNDMHWKAPSSGITVKLLGHFTGVARCWYLQNHRALCCAFLRKILWRRPHHFSNFLYD